MPVKSPNDPDETFFLPAWSPLKQPSLEHINQSSRCVKSLLVMPPIMCCSTRSVSGYSRVWFPLGSRELKVYPHTSMAVWIKASTTCHDISSRIEWVECAANQMKPFEPRRTSHFNIPSNAASSVSRSQLLLDWRQRI